MITEVTDTTFHDEVFHHDGPVVVTFGYPACGPCRQMGKVLDKLNSEDGVKVVKVDITEYPDIAVEYNINSVPTTLFFANGAPRISYKGVLPLSQVRKELAEAVADGKKQPHTH